MQLPLFEPGSQWRPPNLSELPSWKGCKRVGLDVETYDPHLKTTGPSVRTGGYIAGFSFALEDGPKFYIPIQHLGGDNLDRHMALKYLRHQARYYRGIVVGANLQYDLDFLAEVSINFPKASFRDVQIADPLLDELQNSYSLEAIAQRWGFPGKDTATLDAACKAYGLKNPRGELYKLPGRYVGEYGGEDAALPLKVLRKQERKIDELDLWPIYELECQLLPVLLRMKRRGVRIDQDALERVAVWSRKEERAQLDAVQRATGVRMGLGDTEKKAVVLRVLEQIGVQPKYTDKGNPSITKELFDAVDHPVMAHLARARKVNKLRTTFVKSVRAHMVNGRIHTTFNQLRQTNKKDDLVGGRFGRLSSCDPNLQQQPARDDFSAMWRSIYIADNPGQEWLCADYSQQEPRILTHYAELMRLPGAEVMAERFRTDPTTDNHDMMTRIVHPETMDWDTKSGEFKAKRTPCKNIFLGLCYGMGGAKLARVLGLPTKWILNRQGKRIEVAGDEAQHMLDLFDTKVPYVRMLSSKCEEAARERGYIQTILGRRCNFPLLPDGSYDWCYKALNRLIQGSAGDQTKKALVELDAAGHPIQLQVHDEVDLGIESHAQAREIGQIMCECVTLNVPSKVDLEVGPSWGQIKKMVA